MRKFFRVLGWLLVLGFLVRIYFDFAGTVLEDRDFRMAEVGQVWANMHRESLLALQPGVERYLSPAIWENAIFPVLQTPLAPIVLIFAILFLIAGAGSPKLR
ncbi:hypothetical protein [Roseobacter sp. HKCCA0434]|uniref:hypothetical protein n=1 Tax=Roseobacter sp. HKCCA0434 TaxID=3079297 RepID=UPI002905C69B|nr:hypothetical protein [Roseobacter sp. HKCCA0434]